MKILKIIYKIVGNGYIYIDIIANDEYIAKAKKIIYLLKVLLLTYCIKALELG